MSIKFFKHALPLLLGAITLSGTVEAAPAKDEVSLTLIAQQEPGWIRNFNPFLEAGRLHTTRHFIYEPLVVFNEMHEGKPVFRLASDYRFSDDLLSVVFDLREGVKWSDGKPFSADDVVFSFNLLKKHKGLDSVGIWKLITKVEKVGPRQIRFDLAGVNTAIVPELVRIPIVPEHQWKSVGDPMLFTNENPVGTGPFTEVKVFTPQLYTQCRNPYYWDNANLAIDCIRMPQTLTTDQVLTAVRKDELDWFGTFVPDVKRLFVKLDPKHNHYWYPPSGTVALNVNFKSKHPGNREAFNDVAFRRAFSMAMDRQSMVDIGGYGYPTVNEYPSGLGKLYESWNNPEVDKAYGKYNRYDLEGAKKLLAEAGYKDKDGDGFIETPSGKKVEFRIIVPNGWTDWINAVQIAVEGLQKVGVNAKISTPEETAWTEALIAGNFEAAMQGYFVGATPYKYFETVFHSRNMGERGNRFAASRYEDPELDALIDSFIQTTDLDKQKEIMFAVQERVGANQTIIPLFNNPGRHHFTTKRFTGWFSADNPVAKPQPHPDTPERLLHVLALKPVK